MTVPRGVKKAIRPWALTCAVLVAYGCDGEQRPITQVVVVVDSDLAVDETLMRVDIAVQTEDGARTVGAPFPFELAKAGQGEEGNYTLPLSFGIVQPDGGADRFRVVVTGFGPDTGGRLERLVETKALASFQTGRTLQLNAFLRGVCVGRTCEGEGDGEEWACYPWPEQGIAAGDCGPIQAPGLVEIVPGEITIDEELAPTLGDGDAPLEEDDEGDPTIGRYHPSGDGDGDGDGDGGGGGDGDGKPQTGDGDGKPQTGDGDGKPQTGDGDGEPQTGDGDGEPQTSGSDGKTSGSNGNEEPSIDMESGGANDTGGAVDDNSEPEANGGDHDGDLGQSVDAGTGPGSDEETTCGDGACNGSETMESCCQDCGCEGMQVCEHNVCRPPCPLSPFRFVLASEFQPELRSSLLCGDSVALPRAVFVDDPDWLYITPEYPLSGDLPYGDVATLELDCCYLDYSLAACLEFEDVCLSDDGRELVSCHCEPVAVTLHADSCNEKVVTVCGE